ncbi:metallophosphoesterase [Romboutsia sp.]|uniref:metallophosphoesterase n=1 Tax=Romboutsia sp. TaxID=1965302 RepID=UPI003F326CA2
MGMKKKGILMCASLLVTLMIGGYSDSKTTQVNVLATTDLHGQVPYNLSQYVKEEREKDKNITLVDAGDFFDSDGYGPMDKYFYDRLDKKELEIIELENKYVEFPLASDMNEVGYDAVVLGNHEFVSNNRFHLDNMISDFKKNSIDVLSANTYKEDDENYVKPYTIKEIETENGVVKLGILGLTIKEVDEGKYIDENVIVTQPGAHGESISKITFNLEQKNGQWKIVNKKSKLKEFEKDKSDEYAGEVIYKIADIKKEVTEVNLKELTPFEWDKAYVFEANTPVEQIYDTVGYKWRSIVETTKDSMLQTLFMKDNKVVCYLAGDTELMGISINYDKSNYKDGVLEIYPNENDKYSVKKGAEIFETDLTYIGK